MSGGPFRQVALWCWYRGAGFHGFQQQGELRTVQRELLRAFAEARLSRNPVVAGRTDRGVSARMQVLSLRLEREIEAASLVPRLNARLPDDLQVHLAKDARPRFHAAWSASSKEYRYELTHEEAGDLEVLARTAALVPGTRDYRVFHFKTSELRPRTVRTVEVLSHAAGVTLRLLGDGFARHMVRMLVGGMTAVARGEIALDAFRAGLDEQRNFHCPKAAPEPLTLWEVGYSPESDPFTAEERADFSWPRTPRAETAPSRPG